MAVYRDVVDYIGYGVGNKPRYWYSIPGYNGYEISDDGYVRSMKHFRQHPTGILIRARGRNRINPTFELTDNDNKRVIIDRNRLWNLAMSNPRIVPRLTLERNCGSRNAVVLTPKRTEKKEDPYIENLFTVVPDEFEVAPSGLKPEARPAVHFYIDTDLSERT